jgi:4-amino-4-deoxy-L-arabinose transferase-like glycosyltransferase
MRHAFFRSQPMRVLLVALLAALGLRLALWGRAPRLGLISDEGEYLSAASWLAAGRGFDWYQGYLWTRAPIYPLFVALHLRLFGDAPAPLYVTQILLSLLNVALVFLLARRVLPGSPWHAGAAALLAGLYLPFALYTQMLLSETLFIALLLLALLLLAREQIGMRGAALAGALLGLATLTRSLTLGFIPIVALWLLLRGRGQPGAARWAGALLLAVSLLTIAPWTIYSSRMYGGLVLVDTSGAFNLLLGARTAYDGKRSDAQVRDVALGLLGQPTSAPVAATCAPFPGALATQAARQAAMTREGLCLIAARPAAFAQKSLAELIDLFQINYTGAERFTDGFSTGRLAPWYLLALFLLDDTLYVAALPLAVVGWALARTRQSAPLVALAGLWWCYNLAVAPLLFAINRFRLPLMPLVFIFAVVALVALAERLRGSPPQPRSPLVWLAGLLALLLSLAAATPHAYLEPRAPGQDSRWASYLGPYPSSLAITQIALAARPRYENDQLLLGALQRGDLAAAQAILDRGPLGLDAARLGPALLAAHAGDPALALALLPAPEQIAAQRDALSAVLRGDQLRALGDQPGALAMLSARVVDDANPVSWAWAWLSPAPTSAINLGGSLDLGYIDGCYLGEGDATIAPPANFRWCTDGMRLRFPRAATGRPQLLVLRADGRAWQGSPAPQVQVLQNGEPVGQFTLDTRSVAEYQVAVPAAPAGATLVFTLRMPTFVPDAARYNSQQGEAVVGQVQRLGLRLDWAEVREP